VKKSWQGISIETITEVKKQYPLLRELPMSRYPRSTLPSVPSLKRLPYLRYLPQVLFFDDELGAKLDEG